MLGCGDNVVPRDAFEARSGDRIHLLHYAYEDGTRQWDPTRFWDLDRSEQCSVQRWSDGFTYCTPAAVPTVFSDQACTVELGRWLSTQPAPFYFFRPFSLIGSDVVSRVFRRSDAAPVPDITYALVNGNCVETSPAGWSYFMLGDEVPKDAFARVKRIEDTGTNRLALDAYATDDGLYVPYETNRPTLYDRIADEPCRVLLTPNASTTVCEPLPLGEVAFSRDPNCGSTDLIVIAATETVPDVVGLHADGCTSYARRGAEIPTLPLFLPLGGACVSVNPPADAHIFELGPAFDAPVLTRTHEPTPHRLQRILMSDGATTVVDSLLFDSELGVDCERIESDRLIRCLPANSLAQVFPYFRDPACIEPIDVSFVESGACDPLTRFAIDQRGTAPTVRPLVAPYTDTLYEISTADTCLPYVPPGRQLTYTVGAAMSPEAFVAAQVVID